MSRRLSRCHFCLRVCQPRSLICDRVWRLPRRWRAWESTTATTIIARAGKPSEDADPARTAMRPVVRTNAGARMTTMTRAPALAHATTAVAMTVALAPTSLAPGVAHAPTGTTIPLCAATAAALTPMRVAAAPDAARAPATTGIPQPAHAAARAAHRPPTPAPAIAALAQQWRPRVVVASGATSR